MQNQVWQLFNATFRDVGHAKLEVGTSCCWCAQGRAGDSLWGLSEEAYFTEDVMQSGCGVSGNSQVDRPFILLEVFNLENMELFWAQGSSSEA